MKSSQKFFICKHCGNMVGAIVSKGAPLSCCGENMKELVPNTVEASAEKHIPVVKAASGGISVVVGGVEHPMEEAHRIEFIYVETERGGQRKQLKPGEKPSVEFAITNDKPIAVFAYCNLHGLWKTDV
jgi:superoxide reductase